MAKMLYIQNTSHTPQERSAPKLRNIRQRLSRKTSLPSPEVLYSKFDSNEQLVFRTSSLSPTSDQDKNMEVFKKLSKNIHANNENTCKGEATEKVASASVSALDFSWTYFEDEANVSDMPKSSDKVENRDHHEACFEDEPNAKVGSHGKHEAYKINLKTTNFDENNKNAREEDTGAWASDSIEVAVDINRDRKTQETSFNIDEDLEPEEKLKGMSKRHYIDKTTRKACIGCTKPFSIKKRAFHCRRCGEVFCQKCLKYKRKLNKVANPDPEGTPRKVCHGCFQEDSLVLGVTRYLTDEFRKEREHEKNARVLRQRVHSQTTTFWRDQLDVQHECMRLLTGFRSKIKHPEGRKRLKELGEALKTPEWQKSPYWDMERQAEQCRKCKDSKGLRKSSGNCRVCGLALCKKCSAKDLLLFYPDKTPDKEDILEPFLVIINVEGSPGKQPTISLHLYICGECKEFISTKQRANITWYKGQCPTGPMKTLLAMDTTFKSICVGISEDIAKLQERIDSFEGSKSLTSSSEKRKADMANVRSQFDEFDKRFRALKSLVQLAETKSQRRLLQNYLKSKHDFFLENKPAFRRLQTKYAAK